MGSHEYEYVLWKDARRLAKKLCAPGRGVLASDESPSTMGKRLVKAGKENTAENRRQYRSLFYGANLGQYISGAILHPEALDMRLDDGRTFVEALHSQGILVGVKVDEGLEPLADGLEGETSTKGLGSLDDRIESYAKKGARFAKWRAAFRITKSAGGHHRGGHESRWTVSDVALKTNGKQLASYAKICLRKSIVPIVEPEILIDGDHDFDASLRITKEVLAECMHALVTAGVDLDAILLKPQMVSPGVDNKDQARCPGRIARCTLMALRETVPPAVKGIMFLSGGQTEYQSTINLNYLNVVSKAYPDEYAVPYALSFSFGRGLQASVLEMWRRGESSEACMNKAEEIARVNGLAARGAFVEETGGHPTVLPMTGNLQETFRGVY